MFKIVALPFDDYDALDIADGPRWLLVRLARYADREGRCFPSMRTLAAAAKKSLATICRWLKQLYDFGCFTRSREAGRVYRYVIAEPYRLRWRDPPKPAAPAAPAGVSVPAEGVSPTAKQGVSHSANREADPSKNKEEEESAREDLKWRAALRRYFTQGLWVASYGPRPGHSGCRVPAALLAASE